MLLIVSILSSLLLPLLAKEIPESSCPISTISLVGNTSDRLRIFHINDVYTITNLPNFLTAVKELSVEVPSLIMHSGDMLSPPADTRDFGRSMIQALNMIGNHIPILATFGNHECDVPTEQLEHALNASNFNWVISNFDSSYLHIERCLPSHVVIDVNGKPTLGVVGLLTNNRAEYGCIPCGGTTISDPMESVSLIRKFRWDFNIPQVALTHLDTATDETLLHEALVVAILGGHDHYVLSKRVPDPHFAESFARPILKSGEDAIGFHVVDIFFDDMGAVEAIEFEYKHSQDFASDPELQAFVDEMFGGDVAEMKQTVVAKVPDHIQDRRTDRVRWGISDMASYLLDVLKQAFDAEIVLISSGNIRGKRQYTEGIVTEADINAEFPFYDNKPIARVVPGYIVANMIRRSRHDMGAEPKTEILQTDSGLSWDAATQTIRQVNGDPFDPNREYRVVINCAVLAGMDNHLELMEYLNEKDMKVFEPYPDFPAVIFRTLMERLWASIDKTLYTIDDPDTLKAAVQAATGIPTVTDRLVAMMWQYFPSQTADLSMSRSLNNGSTSPPVVGTSLDASLPFHGSPPSHTEL